MSRYDTDNPTITLEDLIVSLDGVNTRQARQKAREILASRKSADTVEDNKLTVTENSSDDKEIADNVLDNLNTHDIVISAGMGVDESGGIAGDETFFENQLATVPRDISFEHNKGVKKTWLESKLKRSHLNK